MNPIKLSRAALPHLGRGVDVPAYDPAAVRTGIVHLGFGGFHRAHMARYTHDLMQRDPEALTWGIAGAGLLETDGRMVEALAPQDRLYTLVERSGEAESVTVIGAVSDLILAAGDPAPLLDAMDKARIVSLTVTEHGYGLNRATRELDPAHPAIAADLARPRAPHSAVGLIVEAYRRRMQAGRPAFTALSCDNIQHNGRVLKQAVLAYARRIDPELAGWIEAHGRFPATMVDRITPITQAPNTADLAARYGVADAWPVFCERFSQWVIEDDFADGRPAWETVGVQFVPDVAPYEFMKLRLLNTSHLAIAGLGRMIGYEYIDQTLRDPRIERYMRALMAQETGPTLAPVPGVDLERYQNTLVERFANPRIKDTVERVNTDAALNYLLDPIRDRLAADESIDLLALALAAWIRRVRGIDEQGRPIAVRHPLAQELREAAARGGGDPRPVLDIRNLFGDLGADPGLVEAVGRWLASLYAVGTSATLDRAAIELGFRTAPPGAFEADT